MPAYDPVGLSLGGNCDVVGLLNMGEALSVNAHLYPDRIGARDLARSMTFRQWNERACRLANGLLGLGLERGDRIAILAYNAVEWLEIYAATAKAGLVMVPINFRLVGSEIAYIVEQQRGEGLHRAGRPRRPHRRHPRRSRDRGGALHPLRRHRRAEADTRPTRA